MFRMTMSLKTSSSSNYLHFKNNENDSLSLSPVALVTHEWNILPLIFHQKNPFLFEEKYDFL